MVVKRNHKMECVVPIIHKKKEPNGNLHSTLFLSFSNSYFLVKLLTIPLSQLSYY